MGEIIALVAGWCSLGAIGAAMARRGSQRMYGKDIYAWPIYLLTIICGPAGLAGSTMGW